jgi:hypothetical protein
LPPISTTTAGAGSATGRDRPAPQPLFDKKKENIMKMLLVATTLGFASLGGILGSQRACCATTTSASTGGESVFACDRTAFTPAERKRHFEVLGPALLALRKGVRELPDGYELELPGDRQTFKLASEWAAGEHACCPFFAIDLHLEPEGGPLRLRLTGREGVKSFLETEASAWIKR